MSISPNVPPMATSHASAPRRHPFEANSTATQIARGKRTAWSPKSVTNRTADTGSIFRTVVGMPQIGGISRAKCLTVAPDRPGWSAKPQPLLDFSNGDSNARRLSLARDGHGRSRETPCQDDGLSDTTRGIADIVATQVSVGAIVSGRLHPILSGGSGVPFRTPRRTHAQKRRKACKRGVRLTCRATARHGVLPFPLRPASGRTVPGPTAFGQGACVSVMLGSASMPPNRRRLSVASVAAPTQPQRARPLRCFPASTPYATTASTPASMAMGAPATVGKVAR